MAEDEKRMSGDKSSPFPDGGNEDLIRLKGTVERIIYCKTGTPCATSVWRTTMS